MTQTADLIVEIVRKRMLDRRDGTTAKQPFMAFLDAFLERQGWERWPHLLTLAAQWEQRESQVILKARQLGISWLAATYAAWGASQHGWTVLIVSQGKAQSAEMLRKCRVALPAATLDTDSQSELAWANGGHIYALPSTERAPRGYTADLVIADEAAYHLWGAENYAAYAPAIRPGGNLLVISTATGPTGWFADTYHLAEQGASGYGAVFLPPQVRWTAVDLDEQRRRLTEEQYRREYPDTPEEAFTAHAGLVHVLNPELLIPDPVPWEECIERFAAFDLGGSDPTAVTMMGLYRRRDSVRAVHQYGEWVKPTGAPLIDEVYGTLARWHAKAPFAWIERDPVGAASGFAASLAVMGLPVIQEPIARDKGLRIDTQALWLEHELLTINPRCERSIHEFSCYQWDLKAVDKYATKTCGLDHADCMDARGQALIRCYYREMKRAAPAKDYQVVQMRTRTGRAPEEGPKRGLARLREQREKAMK